jgi:hypothetical protein
MAAEDRGPLVHARIGVLRGLNRKNNEDHLEKAEGK